MTLMSQLIQFAWAASLAFLASAFWLYFWYYYSKKYTTPRLFLFYAFLIGMAIGGFSWLLEKVFLAGVLPGNIFSLLEKEKSFADLGEIFFVFGVVFFLTALPEEILKFFALKTVLFPSPKFDQIIDGVKFGIVLGLGFALVENTVVIWEQLHMGKFILESFVFVFLFRFFITTLVHSLYGGILGYYFGLSRFYRVFQNTFLWQGFWTVVLFHSFFNFLVLTPFNILTFLLLVSTLFLLLKWYTDRKNFQIALSGETTSRVKMPTFTEPREIQALIAGSTNSNFRLLRKLNLCPFCFHKIDPHQDHCPYCGAKLPKEYLESFNDSKKD